jgi:hypothetical protein
MSQGVEPQESAPVADAATEAESQQEPLTQDEQLTEALLSSVLEAFEQALEDAHTAGEPLADVAAAMADGETIKTSTVGG